MIRHFNHSAYKTQALQPESIVERRVPKSTNNLGNMIAEVHALALSRGIASAAALNAAQGMNR